MQKKIGILFLSLAMLVFSGCGGMGTQAKSDEYQDVHLIMTVNGTNLATDAKAAYYFAEKVKEKSGGKVTVDVFPNDQLSGGNATKGVEMVADGAVDMAAYASSALSVLDQQILVGTIPWAFDNYAEARRIIDGTGGDYYKKVLAKQGLTYLGSVHNGFRQISNSKHPVKMPEDVAGLKIRTPGGEVYMKFFTAFGADPVFMSWGEAFTAIQQGTIDGQENGVMVTASAKVNEIQKYMTLWNYTYENYLFVFNSKIYNSLNAKTQELIAAEAKEACNYGRDLVEQGEVVMVDEFRKGGMEVTELTPEELAPFKAVVAPLVADFKAKYGEEACKAFEIQ